jgi:YtkA-like
MKSALLKTAALALGLAGCATESGSGDGTFPAEPLATIHSQSGLAIEVRTSPDQPPARGESSVELRVSDAHGKLLDGLDVDAEPWMPAMGHGASTDPVKTPEGDGRYRFDKVELFMPGEWELRLTFSGETSDRATARFQIP